MAPSSRIVLGQEYGPCRDRGLIVVVAPAKVLKMVATRTATPLIEASVLAPLSNCSTSASGLGTCFLISATNSLPGPPFKADKMAATPAGTGLDPLMLDALDQPGPQRCGNIQTAETPFLPVAPRPGGGRSGGESRADCSS